MSNARSEDLARGWEIYHETWPRPTTVDEINVALTAEGRGPVSARALKHYRRMERCGLTQYVTINELDIRYKGL